LQTLSTVRSAVQEGTLRSCWHPASRRARLAVVAARLRRPAKLSSLSNVDALPGICVQSLSHRSARISVHLHPELRQHLDPTTLTAPLPCIKIRSVPARAIGSVGANVGAKTTQTKKALWTCIHKALISLVGARGFEPPTTCTPCRYATRLRYAPNS
jgi:hypothetical protein